MTNEFTASNGVTVEIKHDGCPLSPPGTYNVFAEESDDE